MTFNTSTPEKVMAFLGYPFTDAEVAYVQEALDRVDDLSHSTTSNKVQDRIEAWLNELQSISDRINSEREVEGSALINVLRYEGRRHAALVGAALALEVRFDVFSSGAQTT